MEELFVRQRGVALAASYSPVGDTAVVALHSHLHELLPPAGIGVVTFDRAARVSRLANPVVAASSFKSRTRSRSSLRSTRSESAFGESAKAAGSGRSLRWHRPTSRSWS